MDLPQQTWDTTSPLNAEMQKARLELSVTKGVIEGKSKREVTNPLLEEQFKWFFSKEGLGTDSCIQHFGIDK